VLSDTGGPVPGPIAVGNPAATATAMGRAYPGSGTTIAGATSGFLAAEAIALTPHNTRCERPSPAPPRRALSRDTVTPQRGLGQGLRGRVEFRVVLGEVCPHPVKEGALPCSSTGCLGSRELAQRRTGVRDLA
jgi:hypothetical protein